MTTNLGICLVSNVSTNKETKTRSDIIVLKSNEQDRNNRKVNELERNAFKQLLSSYAINSIYLWFKYRDNNYMDDNTQILLKEN